MNAAPAPMTLQLLALARAELFALNFGARLHWHWLGAGLTQAANAPGLLWFRC